MSRVERVLAVLEPAVRLRVQRDDLLDTLAVKPPQRDWKRVLPPSVLFLCSDGRRQIRENMRFQYYFALEAN